MDSRQVHESIVRILVAGAGILVCTLAAISPSFAETRFSLGISGGEDGIDGFHLSISEYYRVPRQEVLLVHRQGIPHDELPVVFFLAGRAHVHPNTVILLRRSGMSWMDITLHFGLCPDIYYVPVRYVHQHHGHAYGHYQSHPNSWKNLRLKDADIISQVNLIFISEHNGCPPERIMEERSQGRRFTEINRQISREHGARSVSLNRNRPSGGQQVKRPDGPARHNPGDVKPSPRPTVHKPDPAPFKVKALPGKDHDKDRQKAARSSDKIRPDAKIRHAYKGETGPWEKRSRHQQGAPDVRGHRGKG
ncbi:MAG: hypothetical protein WAR22_05150 [Desulfomonilia bacterium]